MFWKTKIYLKSVWFTFMGMVDCFQALLWCLIIFVDIYIYFPHRTIFIYPFLICQFIYGKTYLKVKSESRRLTCRCLMCLLWHLWVSTSPVAFPIHMYLYWSSKWQPTLIFLPGKLHGQRSLAGCSPWGRIESDTTEQLNTHIY